MNYLKEYTLELLKDESVRDLITKCLEEVIRALFKEAEAIPGVKTMEELYNLPFTARESYFLMKLKYFMDGLELPPDTRSSLIDFITEQGKKKENALRFLQYMDDIDTLKKIPYIINATRALLMRRINAVAYFRIFYTIIHTLDEDLEFLKNNYHLEDSSKPETAQKFSYNLNVQGLLNNGLMWQIEYNTGKDQKYGVSGLAELVDKYALNYENEEKYSDRDMTIPAGQKKPNLNMNNKIKLEEITNDDIDHMDWK